MRSEAWRPAAAARNRSPREAGTPPSRHYDLGARSSLHGSARHLPAVVGRRAPKETEARPREPKIATVERREASVPRHKRVHARLDALWDARRLASAWPAALCAGLTGVPLSTRTFLGAPPTPRFGVSEATMQNSGAKTRRGKEGVRVVWNRKTRDGKIRICRKTGKYRGRTSQRVLRRKRVHAEARRDEGVCVVGGREP